MLFWKTFKENSTYFMSIFYSSLWFHMTLHYVNTWLCCNCCKSGAGHMFHCTIIISIDSLNPRVILMVAQHSFLLRKSRNWLVPEMKIFCTNCTTSARLTYEYATKYTTAPGKKAVAREIARICPTPIVKGP